jgi:predicted AAA+ superfamily ATPase
MGTAAFQRRSYLHYSRVKGTLGYWATPSGSEVDFVWWYGKKTVLIEAKRATDYRREHRKGIESFLEGKAATSYIVYRGDRELDVEGTRVLPVGTFLKRLHAGEILV